MAIDMIKNGLTERLPQVPNSKERNPTTDKKLADIEDVSEKTYRMVEEMYSGKLELLQNGSLRYRQ